VVVEEVTQWINKLGRGDPRAAQILWEKYFDRLVNFARRKMEGIPRRASDEEDVALSAMHSFCQGMAKHRFDQVNDREDLWKLLITITARKACAQRRRQFTEKRGGGQVRGESVFLRADPGEGRDEGIGAVLGEEPTPELACMVAEDCRRMLDGLEDETLRQVALLTLEGYNIQEIAEELGCVRRTVDRKLERIREKWSRLGLNPDKEDESNINS
jgi:DNA-directed RNA polymerase specialized sigma24 family protein